MKQHYPKAIVFFLIGIFLGYLVPYTFHAFTKIPVTSGYRDLEMKIDVAGQEIYIWRTVIAPEHEGKPGLDVHRHEYARVIIPLTGGVLRRKESTGETINYDLTVGKPIFLPADLPSTHHTDLNPGKEVIEVIVVQFTQDPVTVKQLNPEDLQKVMFK